MPRLDWSTVVVVVWHAVQIITIITTLPPPAGAFTGIAGSRVVRVSDTSWKDRPTAVWRIETPLTTWLQPLAATTPAFIHGSRSVRTTATTTCLQSTPKDDTVADVPEDWSEDDVLVEFDEDDEGEAVVAEGVEVDDDFDEDEIDEIDLDEEEDEEEFMIEEESLGVRVGEVDAWEEPAGAFDDTIEWDEEEDGGDYELDDDPDDPDYTRQKELVELAITASERRAADEEFDPLQFVLNDLTPEMAKQLDELPFFKEVEDISKDMILTDEDVVGIDLERDVAAVSDLMEDDPYPRHLEDEVNYLERGTGLTDDDMDELDKTYKGVQEVLKNEPWDQVMLNGMLGYDGLSNTTLAEMEECLGEIGGSAYNVTNWLLYDLGFNVSNLILAAIKHNRDAPILFQHWYPQLVTYERYQHARDRNFDFNWEDVESADMDELERYYAGFGYDEIPNKAPAETGIISLEDLDEEEIKMAAFENWMTDVYNPEADRKDFDDDTMRDEDNVFSEFYEAPQHPDLPTMEDAEDDLEQWREEIGDDPEVRSYRDMMGRSFEYEVVQDKEFEREFRGHLIIACTGEESDLDIAEKITVRFEKEFGKKVFVETRVMALAREEDNVFEIWLESYEIDLLHSKKRATSNAKGWNGPAEVDDAQIDFLSDRVRFLISDDARYSYRMEMDLVE